MCDVSIINDALQVVGGTGRRAWGFGRTGDRPCPWREPLLYIIIASGAAFAIGGDALGSALARLTPSYYRSVFHGGESPAFDPVQVGIGLGVSQGLIAGLVVGSIVVLAVGSLRVPVARKGSERGDGVFRQLMLIAGGLLALGLCFGSGLVIGLMRGTRDTYHLRYLEEREAIVPAIGSDPAFARVEVEERSNGGVELVGEVPTPADLDRLRGLVVRTLGEPRANEAMLAVGVSR